MPRERGIELRTPTVADGPAVWRLVVEAGSLDRNSSYLYLLLCRDFGATCQVAEQDGRLVGFVTGYRLPADPETIFVWQVGVAKDTRGRGLAGRMLQELLLSEGCRGVRFLETTVAPSNEASRALFQGLARRLDTRLSEGPGFAAESFPEGGHEREPRLRIGPFDRPGLARLREPGATHPSQEDRRS